MLAGSSGNQIQYIGNKKYPFAIYSIVEPSLILQLASGINELGQRSPQKGPTKTAAYTTGIGLIRSSRVKGGLVNPARLINPFRAM